MKPRLCLTSLFLCCLGLVHGFTPPTHVNRHHRPHVQRNRFVPKSVTAPTKSAHKSPLFVSKKASRDLPNDVKQLPKFNVGRLAASLIQLRSKLSRKIRRATLVLWSAMVIWAATLNFGIQPSHASTTAAPQEPIQERILKATSPSLDTIVDRYVEKYMFNDDTYDPVESLYKEAYQDATQGTYPKALKEVKSSILGQETGKGLASVNEKSLENVVGGILKSALGMLQKRGLSESASIAVLAASLVILGPFTFLFGGMVIGGISKRNMNKVMKKRYGDTYTVDATIRTEEEVEAPEDEDDDEDNDDDDDDEDDDDDDDEDDNKR